MSLNIKNERVHALVREVAARTGTSQTGAVEQALQRYLDELTAADRLAERHRRTAAVLAEFDRSEIADRIPDDSDFLYDEQGMPA